VQGYEHLDPFEPMTVIQSRPLGLEHLLHGDHLDIPARELMTPRVVSVIEDASLHEAFRVMSTHHIHAILVVARDTGRPLGWLTSHGLLAHAGDKRVTRAREAIMDCPACVEPTAPARTAAQLMLDRGISHVLVGASAEVPPQGVISDYDLARLASL